MRKRRASLPNFVKSFHYFTYGLGISCDFALPELSPREAEVPVDAPCDVRFELCAEPKTPDDFLIFIRRHNADLAWPKVAHFRLENGEKVTIHAAPGVSHATLRAYLLGPVLALLLFQRGFLVMHCSCVALRDGRGEWGAVGFLGHSGDGKSTLAAALHARGHRMVSDDVIAIPTDLGVQSPPIFPAYPQLRLSPQSVEALGENAAVLPLLNPHEERRVRRADALFETQSVPLRALCVLGYGETAHLERLRRPAALLTLLQHTYCVNLRDPDEAAAQFRQCAALAQSLPVFQLERPRDLARLGETAALIETRNETNWA